MKIEWGEPEFGEFIQLPDGTWVNREVTADEMRERSPMLYEMLTDESAWHFEPFLPFMHG